MRKLVDEHHKHRAAVVQGFSRAPLLLALTFDESQRLRPLLEQVIRAEDGLLVDASEFGDSIDLDGDLSEVAELRVAVDAALRDINALPDANEQLILRVDGAVIRIEGPTEYAAASRGQQTLRGLLAALFAVDLRGSDLAALIYAEDALDSEHKAIIWKLLMELPTLLDRPASSTLVVVAGDGELEFDLHCTGDPSLRWVVNDTGLQSRYPRDRDVDVVERLARLDAGEAPLVMLMLGAGASAGYLPLGNDVRNRALERMMGTAVDRHNYGEVAGAMFRHLIGNTPGRLLPGEEADGIDEFVRRLTLERVLREERHEQHRELSSTLQWFSEQNDAAITRIAADEAAGLLAADPLARLLALRKRLVVVTVNFDHVIEAKGGTNVRAFVTDSDLEDLGDYLNRYAAGEDLPVPLIKAHGDIAQPGTIVADVTTTRGGLATPMLAALESLRERLLGQPQSPLWHVGYSMRDIDLEDYWASPAFAVRAKERWVSPLPDASVRRFIEEKRIPRWSHEADPQTADEPLVTLTASDFFSLLSDAAARHW